jgi:hypothetical protein
VALSCGGTVALLADRGTDTTVVTIFGGEVIDHVLGDFARWKHWRWGLNDMDAVCEQRQAEDAAATARLGAGSRWLGFPDAIYRVDRCVADQELYGEVRTAEQPIAEVVSLKSDPYRSGGRMRRSTYPWPRESTSIISWYLWLVRCWLKPAPESWPTRIACTPSTVRRGWIVEWPL